jgi:hypothetical protein
LSQNTTLKARVYRDGWEAGLIYTLSYSFTTAPPTFSPPAGPYTSVQNVTITTVTPASTIRYTLDGADPTVSSPIYTGPVLVDGTLTLKARAYRSGWPDSPVSPASYPMNLGQLPPPVARPGAGA